MINTFDVIVGDNIKTIKIIPDESVNCVVTSPPYYGLRDYENEEQVGLEETPELFIQKLVELFREVRRVLRDDGTVWLNLGDSYAGSGKGPAGNIGKTHNERHMEGKQANITPAGYKPKDLMGIPWRVALALQQDGWYLRQDIIWHKPSCLPESVTDRCTKSHEYIFLLSKSRKYFYDHEAIKEPANPDNTMRDRDAGRLNNTPGKTRSGGLKHNSYEMRNKRSVWSVSPKPYHEAHFAVFPPELIVPCVLAGCPIGGVVLDPFGGSGTTAGVANALGRNAILLELNEKYATLIPNRVDYCKQEVKQILAAEQKPHPKSPFVWS